MRFGQNLFPYSHNLRARCPLWVKSGHVRRIAKKGRCERPFLSAGNVVSYR
jgi:hypothetical protein